MQSQLRDLGGGEVILMAAMILLMVGVGLLMRIEKSDSAKTPPSRGQGMPARAYLERQFGPARSGHPGDVWPASGDPVAAGAPISPNARGR